MAAVVLGKEKEAATVALGRRSSTHGRECEQRGKVELRRKWQAAGEGRERSARWSETDREEGMWSIRIGMTD
ncbi:hypothetical protein E2562_014358 [Oryza meyeriana var. granulata]|uniref:Uncharacterized protein n=1 Tax=Oryza meyeriana var. granulata TaxID=110450 RepID=A0A6G1C670_9ORYZ|nr:hypothetical protein E2562_014358 [Oryza meyeriana var. granulata]